MSASLDEAYLNITSYVTENNITPIDAITQLRAEIYEKTKITTSAGLAANTLLAKIGSNKNKPNDQFVVPNDRIAIMQFMHSLPCRKINGIGKVFERVLSDALGIHTVDDIYSKRHILYKLLSEKSFDFLIQVYLGIGATTVRSAEDYERKSVGSERTFRDQGDPDILRGKLKEIAEELAGDMERVQTAVSSLISVACADDRHGVLRSSTSYILMRFLRDRRC
jgi:DNA polymerase kappa